LPTYRINNTFLTPIIIINLYMPTHSEDTPLITSMLETIQTTINIHLTHIIILGDNRDQKLIGRYNDQVWNPPNEVDKEWTTFTNSLYLQHIHTNTTYTRQGGKNYTSTTLVDGFYIKKTK
jgi:hypothetical protein